MLPRMRLGIDFGTTRTVVAGVQDGRHPVVAFDEGGEFREHIPGIAALRRGELLVGWAAARALADGTAEHAIRSVKRSRRHVQEVGADVLAVGLTPGLALG